MIQNLAKIYRLEKIEKIYIVNDTAVCLFPESDDSQKIIFNYYKTIKLTSIFGVLEVIPSMVNFLIIFDNQITNLNDVMLSLKKLKFQKLYKIKKEQNYEYEIPICYEECFNKDLFFLSKKLELNIEEIINLHLSKKYKISMMGFLAGLPFMGKLPNKLVLERRQNPRKIVNEGSVGIAIGQCVIYPQDSPGGWHIIGSTPLKIFDKRKEEPIIFKIGDFIKFKRISSQDFLSLKNLIENSSFEIKRKKVLKKLL